MSVSREPMGTLAAALAHAQQLLASQPELAAEQAAEILRVVPEEPLARLILASARRATGDARAALEALGPLLSAQPRSAAAHLEHGRALGLAGDGEAAIAALRRAVALAPELADAWRTLGDHLRALGDAEGADAAYANHIRASTRDPRLLEPAAALCEGRIAVAEAMLRAHLERAPTDVAAIRMLAEVAARLGRYGDAEKLLARCIELAPSFAAARLHYAVVLHRQNKASAALAAIEDLRAVDARNPSLHTLEAAVRNTVGEHARAIELLRSVLAQYPKQAKVWMSYGHTLKTAGRLPESVDAYRKSIELAPGLGEAYWSLANLKTYRFSATDLVAMRAQLVRSDLSNEDRFHFDFALGKALEDAGDPARSFAHYEQGNALRKAAITYDPDETSALVQRTRALFTREFFGERRGLGSPAPDPIFIVGLPRAGSTLLEQILASHSAVEGTMELPDMIAIARRLAARKSRSQESRYPGALAAMDADALRALGEQYLSQTRIQRKTAAPFFIDKMPNNWAHVGLIQLILPNAKIVDARRHPLSCCFSGFKQHFARGQHFTYSLTDIGRYYRDYVTAMAHWDAVLPGRVHRVHYEAIVDDAEGEIRRLLAHCGLPFEEACLRFHENRRAVRTASSEQVRSPIYRESLEGWRPYEPWLTPLKEALGPVLAAYPDAPKEA